MEESYNSHRIGAIVANVLMIVALFMPAFSILGKLSASFWELTRQSLTSKEWAFLLALSLMIVTPIYNIVVIVTNKKIKIGAFVPIGALLLFLYIFNSRLSSSYSLDSVIEYKAGFYIYFFSAIALLVIRIVWPEDPKQQVLSGANSCSALSAFKGLLHSDTPMRFLPLDFMDSFEEKHFAQICGDNPLSADTARYSVVIGTVTTYMMLILLARFDIDSIYSLILSAVIVVGMACVFLLPVFKGAYGTIDKVVYCLFIILTAIICAIFGMILSSLVIIYIVVFLFIYLIRKYVNNK